MLFSSGPSRAVHSSSRSFIACVSATVAPALFGLLLSVQPRLGQAAAQVCTDSIDAQAPVLTSGFAFDQHNTRNQRSRIDADNVSRLTPSMSFAAPGVKEKRGAVAVTEQTIYFSEGTDVVARHRTSGCEYWRFAVPMRYYLGAKFNFVRSSAVYLLPPAAGKPALVIVGDNYGHVYALDARTGLPHWQRFVGTDKQHHTVTGSFQVHEGVLYVPLATKEVASTFFEVFSLCCKSHGMLLALDAYTGTQKWAWHATDKAVYNQAHHSYAPSGISLWGVPLIDAQRGQILIGTGQNLSRPTTAHSDAIVALDIGTGQPRWVFQAVADDAFNVACNAPKLLEGQCNLPAGPDHDFGAPPILATLPTGRAAILAGGKNGVVYALDPASGGLIWQTRVSQGGQMGGIHWGMATDARHVYAGLSDMRSNKFKRLDLFNFIDLQKEANTNYLVPDAQPGVVALDLRDGRIVWRQSFTHVYEDQPRASIFSAAVSVTNNVLFASSMDGMVRALRTSNGEVLWSFNADRDVVDVDGEAGHGGTLEQVGAIPAGDSLYLNAGYSTFGGRSSWQSGEGNVLFVFRLPD